MEAKERIERAADKATDKIPSGYDLKFDECCYLHDVAKRGENGVFEALWTAYKAGFIRGHLATARGRMNTAKAP